MCALGLADSLVGVTHECDFPRDVVENLPVVTSSPLLTSEHGEASDETNEDDESDAPALLSAREIDEKVRAALESGDSLYHIDHELLRSLKPDLILTQGLCDVCAVNHQAVKAAVESLGDTNSVILDLTPTSLEGVLDTFKQVGDATGKQLEAEKLITETQARWDAVKAKAASAGAPVKTLLLEWPDPPFSAGHWNPELLTLAGGSGGPWDVPGEPSRTLTWDEIAAFAPDVVVLIACGWDADRAIDEAYAFLDVPQWFGLPAVQNAECYAVDGNAYYNRPGPRLAESAEILATILHPDAFTEMLPPYSVRLFPDDLLTPPEDEGEGEAEEETTS